MTCYGRVHRRRVPKVVTATALGGNDEECRAGPVGSWKMNIDQLGILGETTRGHDDCRRTEFDVIGNDAHDPVVLGE